MHEKPSSPPPWWSAFFHDPEEERAADAATLESDDADAEPASDAGGDASPDEL